MSAVSEMYAAKCEYAARPHEATFSRTTSAGAAPQEGAVDRDPMNETLKRRVCFMHVRYRASVNSRVNGTPIRRGGGG